MLKRIAGLDGAYRDDKGSIIFKNRPSKQRLSEDKYIQTLEKRLKRLEARVRKLEEGK